MTGSGETLAFHASDPRAGGGYVLLLQEPGADGWVRVRRWSSPDYTAAAPERREATADLRAAVAREAREGWRFTLPVERILAWLAIPEGPQTFVLGRGEGP